MNVSISSATNKWSKVQKVNTIVAKEEAMKHRYDAAAELALIFIKNVPICFFWMTVTFGVILGTDELQRNWSIVLKSFFIMSFAAVAGTTFIHRLGLWVTTTKNKGSKPEQGAP